MDIVKSSIGSKQTNDGVQIGFNYSIQKSNKDKNINIKEYFDSNENIKAFLLDNGEDFMFVDETMFEEALVRYGDRNVLGIEKDKTLPTIFIGDKETHKLCGRMF